MTSSRLELVVGVVVEPVGFGVVTIGFEVYPVWFLDIASISIMVWRTLE